MNETDRRRVRIQERKENTKKDRRRETEEESTVEGKKCRNKEAEKIKIKILLVWL